MDNFQLSDKSHKCQWQYFANDRGRTYYVCRCGNRKRNPPDWTEAMKKMSY